jgi:ABC-2 type transport system ATP-binding protein
MRGVSIEVADLRKRLGKNQALDGVSLSFEPGVLHGLIGPDGAGKTTLMRLFMGLLAPDAGSIRYFSEGRPVAFAELRPKMTYMPQRQSLYADLSIGEHLDFFRDLYRLSPEDYARRREELLAITRLGDFLDRPAGQLSGGMYKKLGLMCALLQSPMALFLDEPTNGVDPISRREFWDLLYRLADGRVTIVLSTSYMDEAERCARVHLLDRGQVLATGEPRRVLREAGARSFEELFLTRAGEAR